MRGSRGARERSWGLRHGRAPARALAVCLWLALPGSAFASSNDVRVRSSGAMELFYQPNEQPSNDEIVNIRKQAWDLVWTGMNGTLDASALDASFTGATTHHTVTAHRTVTRR